TSFFKLYINDYQSIDEAKFGKGKQTNYRVACATLYKLMLNA
ncbi:hypothetical protein BACCELL_04493, partial [Bacteroides cellulosilyticus DSM 14838]